MEYWLVEKQWNRKATQGERRRKQKIEKKIEVEKETGE